MEGGAREGDGSGEKRGGGGAFDRMQSLFSSLPSAVSLVLIKAELH